MKEFEAQGGLFIEEADPDEIGVEYSSLPKLPAKKKRKKVKTNGQGEEDLSKENERLRKELEELRGKTQVQEEELASTELSDWAQFELHPKLMVGLARQKFRSPTPVQARCLLPALRQRKDVIGAAETGSGKTLAFGLPILHHSLSSLPADAMSNDSAAALCEHGPRALVLLPTRELAVQVQAHLNAVAQSCPLHTECLVGGISTQKQKRLLRRKPAVVVGTPGRIFALLGMGEEADKCEWLREGLKNVRHLVLDEADRLVESGHFKELDKILELLYQSVERLQQLQTFIFSATLTLDPRAQRGEDGANKVDALMSRLKFRESRAVFTVDLTKEPKETQNDETEEQSVRRAKLPQTLEFKELVCSSDKDKEPMLAVWLLRRFRWGLPLRPEGGGYASRVAAEIQKNAAPRGGRIIIFVNAISYVQRLFSVLALLLESPSASKVLSRVHMSSGGNQGAPPGLSVDVLDLHSKMRQKDRLKRIERFRKLKDAVLVCTDIAARGLDVPDVSAVIHFQAPRGSEVFVHRSGRTARAGREGQSIAFVAPTDVTHWNKVYRAIGIVKEDIERVETLPEEITAAKEASRLAAELEKKVHQTFKQSNEDSWLKKAAREADLMLDEEDDTREVGKSKAPSRVLWGLFQEMQVLCH